MAQSTVFVTGANGYIAQNLVALLLSKSYRVIGLVRSQEKGEHLALLVNDPSFDYVVVPVLEQEGAFDRALKDHPEIETFYHTASPVIFDDGDVESRILTPAINGTKYALNSLQKYAPQLKHFVFTSVSAAQFDKANPKPVDEDSWNSLTYKDATANGFNAYVGSKKFAEEAVWTFRKQQNPKFSIATILPSFVFGPQAYEASLNSLTSTAGLFSVAINAPSREALEKAVPFPFCVDIRDVVRAHIFAAEDPRADGKRLALTSGPYNADTILEILAEKFPGKSLLKPNVPPAPLMPNIFNTEQSRQLLGEFITPEKTITDAIAQQVRVPKI